MRGRTNWLRWLPVALGLLLPFGAADEAEAAPRYAVEVDAGTLNVRDDVWGTVLGQVHRGDRFAVTGQRSGWLRIDFRGREAWISASYAERVPATAVVVDVDALNVRSGGSTRHGRVGLVRRGQAYVRLAERGRWAQIQFDQRQAWVAAWLTDETRLGARAGGGSSSSGSSSSGGRAPRPRAGETSHPPMQASDYAEEVLARICKGEAGVTGYEGKVAVCAVVLNRVRSARFPDTIPGVVHQPYQFSAYNANVRDRLYWGPIPRDCWRAAREALAGRDPSRGATFYFNPYLVSPSWADGMEFLVRIGTDASDTHDFYRPR